MSLVGLSFYELRAVYSMFLNILIIRTVGLEKCIPVPPDYAIVGVNHSYEPLWVFETNDHKFLPLEKKAINLLLHFHEHPELTRLTPGQLASEEAKAEAAEVEEFEQKLGESMTPWQQMKDLIE